MADATHSESAAAARGTNTSATNKSVTFEEPTAAGRERAADNSRSGLSAADDSMISFSAEHELGHFVQTRYESIRRQLEAREEENRRLTKMLREIEEDYQYNLDLIADRDSAINLLESRLRDKEHELEDCRATTQSLQARTEQLNGHGMEHRQRLEGVIAELKTKSEKQRLDYEGMLRSKDEELHRLSAESQQYLRTQLSQQEESRIAQLHVLESQLRDKDSKTKALEEDLRASLATVDKQLRERSNEVARVTHELTLAEQTVSQLQHRIEDVERRREKEAEDHHSSTAQARQNLDDLRRELETSTEEKNGKIAALQSSVMQREKELDQCRRQLTNAEEHLHRLQQSRHADLQEIEQDKTRIIDRCEAVTKEKERQLQALEERAEAASADANKYKRAAEEAQFALNEVRTDLAVSHEQMETLQKKLQVAAEDLEARKNDIRELTNKYRQLDTSHHELRLRQNHDETSHVTAIEGMKKQMDDSKMDHVRRERVLEDEITRLRNELRISEDLRRAAECDVAAQCGLQEKVHALEGERGDLANRIKHLEEENTTVRNHVLELTREMENDPALHKAKENLVALQEKDARIAELQQAQYMWEQRFRHKEREVVEINRMLEDEPTNDIQKLLNETISLKHALEQERAKVRALEDALYNNGTSLPPNLAPGTAPAGDHAASALRMQLAECQRDVAKYKRKYDRSKEEMTALYQQKDGEIAKGVELHRAIERLEDERQKLMNINTMLKYQLSMKLDPVVPGYEGRPAELVQGPRDGGPSRAPPAAPTHGPDGVPFDVHMRADIEKLRALEPEIQHLARGNMERRAELQERGLAVSGAPSRSSTPRGPAPYQGVVGTPTEHGAPRPSRQQQGTSAARSGQERMSASSRGATPTGRQQGTPNQAPDVAVRRKGGHAWRDYRLPDN